jgi:hypothetical protein
MAGGVVQVVKLLPSKSEVLSPNSSTAKKQQKKTMKPRNTDKFDNLIFMDSNRYLCNLHFK